MTVAVSGLAKTYRTRRRDAGVVALDGVDISAGDGELLVVMGPSGSGKSTLLRCIAGLERPDRGRVLVDGRDVTDLPPGERRLAMVFQDLALYPHLSVESNVGLGLRAARVPRGEVHTAVVAATGVLGLGDLLDRRPGELSGGERQRVALARAIVREPACFLFDEPLSHLDTALHVPVWEEILSLQRRLGIAAVYVTHDQGEAMVMGDRVAVLRDGRVEQIGAPLDLYDRPATVLVARLLGTPPMNLLPAPVLGVRADGAALVGLRPERVGVGTGNGARVTGRVVTVEHLGGHSVTQIAVGNDRIAMRTERAAVPAVGEEVGLDFDDSDLHRFDDAGQRL